MTEGQYRKWADIAAQCAMPQWENRNVAGKAFKAFPHIFEALRREREKVAQLEAVMAYIDAHAPLADATCNEPGITLSEAARRAMTEVQP